MPPLNRCNARRWRWPHLRCTGHGWPGMHEAPHRWWGVIRWR